MPNDKPATAALALQHGKRDVKHGRNDGRHDKKRVPSDKPAPALQHGKKLGKHDGEPGLRRLKQKHQSVHACQT